MYLKMKFHLFATLLILIFTHNLLNAQVVTGELKKWHKVTLVFEGPVTSELAEENPFLSYRLNVSFTHSNSGKEYLIPGYYATDGNAGDTGAESGNIWKVHFAPDEIGEWNYKVDFKKGKWAAVRTSEKLKSGDFMDGTSGKFTIKETDKTGKDFRGKGMLLYVGERYLKFQNGEYFLKCGSDAPENFLAYDQFDGTFQNDGHKDDLVILGAATLNKTRLIDNIEFCAKPLN